MTEEEYMRKRNAYATSDAPREVIDAAIKALDAQWQSIQLALVTGGDLDDIE